MKGTPAKGSRVRRPRGAAALQEARTGRAATAPAGGPPPRAARAAGLDLGGRVRALRAAGGLTIKTVAARGGLSPSTISKIENNLLSPTYENIIKLARGLGVDISELFSPAGKQLPHGRRSITRHGQGTVFRTRAYDYEMLCTDLVAKKMVPLKAVIKAREVRDFGSLIAPNLIAHEGEEVLLVLSGEVVLLTEFYEPTVLRRGDCAYFDSTMGHVCLVQGLEEAEVFWVCSSPQAVALVTGEGGGGGEGQG